MPDVSIYVFLNRMQDLGNPAPRCVTWRGSVDWPGAPRPGDTWFHCGGWAGESFDRVSFCGPEDGKTFLSIEVRTTYEVLAHLAAEHGFEE